MAFPSITTMPKSAKEIYPTIEKYVSKDALTWIVKDCLGRNELEAIAHQCRIDFLGSSTLSKSTDHLSREIANEYFKNPKARELIGAYLNHATQNEVRITATTSISELLGKLREPQSPMMATGAVGKYLWALLGDERSEALSLIPIFILKVLDTVRKYSNILQELKKKENQPSTVPSRPIVPPLPSHAMKLQEEVTKLKKDVEESYATLHQLEEKNEQLEDRLKDLQNEHKITLSENQGMKHEKNTFMKKIKDLEQTISEMKSKYNALEDLQSRIHQYERDNKILRYELEKKTAENQSAIKAKEDLEKSQKIIPQIEKRLKESETLLEEKEESIQRLKESLKKEAIMRKESKKVVKSAVPRVGIFVDVQNIYYAAKERFSSKLDFQKLLHETLQGRRLVRAIAYVVKTPEINQGNFINILAGIGYEVKARSLKIRLDGSAKGDWDLGIAIDTISLADKLDVVVLVSGDGDFVDLVRMLQTRNIRVEVASFPHNTSGDLMDVVDLHFPLDEKILL